MRLIVLLDEAEGGQTALPSPLSGPAPFAWDRMLVLEGGAERAARVAGTGAAKAVSLGADAAAFHVENGWLAASLPRAAAKPARIAVFTWADDRELDRLVAPLP